MAAHGLGVSLGLPVIFARQRRLGHQGPQMGIVRGIGQLGQLLVGHAELVTELAQPTSDLKQPSLDRCFGHTAIVRVGRGTLRLDGAGTGFGADEIWCCRRANG